MGIQNGSNEANGFFCRGKLWLEERTPEQLKGESG
jgi:hypothetical protein